MPDVASAKCRTCYGLGRCQACLGTNEEKFADGSGKGVQTRPCTWCSPGIPGRCWTCMGTGTRPDEAA